MNALGSTTHVQDALGAALGQTINQLRASQERRLPERPDSAVQVCL